MKIKYLGTAAAERVPGIFCKCTLCENARNKKGREIRTQTQFIVNDELLIDFPGDTYLHVLRDDIDLSQFNHLIISHWHSDHFYGEDLAYRMQGYSQNLENTLEVYGNAIVKEFYDRAFSLEEREDPESLHYNLLKPYEKVSIGKYTLYPLPAQHGHFEEDCFIFALDDGRDVFLDTHDTGYFTEEMFEYLQKSELVFSIISLDCTGQIKESSNNHMNWSDNLKLVDELKKRQLITDKTKIVSNHFSHNGGLTYQEMNELSTPKNIITSYDGLVVSTD